MPRALGRPRLGHVAHVPHHVGSRGALPPAGPAVARGPGRLPRACRLTSRAPWRSRRLGRTKSIARTAPEADAQARPWCRKRRHRHQNTRSSHHRPIYRIC
eukprot:1947100-Prymnesium_polylepis.1